MARPDHDEIVSPNMYTGAGSANDPSSSTRRLLTSAPIAWAESIRDGLDSVADNGAEDPSVKPTLSPSEATRQPRQLAARLTAQPLEAIAG
ncbi:hypothetical protein [Nocardia farcinica]|uniref:hypothetical protein n=1 Tax=Nocardia farcinica TaxID=37329 RepID=UPI001895E9C1|nr:hypothetical protein [Nocardia farcinica]MBF6185988.1 hypothetical protein [Nocardia farcinica]MBF6382518.1 hypothetical protein [Nocardia farcinica]MBF6408817.1 hypothetical protein [Nocardia farcinica]